MGKIIEAVRKAGLTVPVIVGGAPVSEAFANSVAADGYAENAPEAVELAKRLIAEGLASECQLPAA